jgi:hypothetical protein
MPYLHITSASTRHDHDLHYRTDPGQPSSASAVAGYENKSAGKVKAAVPAASGF